MRNRINTGTRAIMAALAAAGLLSLGAMACDSDVVDPVSGASGHTVTAQAPGGPDAPNSLASSNAQLGAIHALLSSVHGALNASDYDAILASFAEDATFTVGETVVSGRTAVADFLATSPAFVNGWASLTPSYKTEVDLSGKTATFAFECIFVPDTGNLAGQTVVAHLSARGTLVKVGDRWLVQTWVGSPGPLP